MTSDPMNAWLDERTSVLGGARRMHAQGLVIGTSGNVSARCGPEFLAVTATSTPYETMTLGDIVVTDFAGDPVIGEALPSTESMMHIAIYQARPDVAAVVHSHSVYASGLSVAGQELVPMIDEMVVHLGGRIHVSTYAFPGTEELGARVVEALGDRAAVLIGNHGVVGVGRSVSDAVRVCEQVEHAARIFTVARTVGDVRELPEDSVASLRELYRMRLKAEETA